MGRCAAPRKTKALAMDALAPLKLALSLGSPCTHMLSPLTYRGGVLEGKPGPGGGGGGGMVWSIQP